MAKNTEYTGRSIVIARDLLKSAAFCSLTTGAPHIVLMTFMLKRQMKEIKGPKRESTWEVKNDGRLAYTYAEAKRQGISAGRFRDALDMLLDRGFIRIVRTGEGKHRNISLFGLSDEWKEWRPGDEPKAKRKKRTPSERKSGFQPGNRAWESRNSSTGNNTRSSTIEKPRS